MPVIVRPTKADKVGPRELLSVTRQYRLALESGRAIVPCLSAGTPARVPRKASHCELTGGRCAARGRREHNRMQCPKFLSSSHVWNLNAQRGCQINLMILLLDENFPDLFCQREFANPLTLSDPLAIVARPSAFCAPPSKRWRAGSATTRMKQSATSVSDRPRP
jgi:hypothetical protein